MANKSKKDLIEMYNNLVEATENLKSRNQSFDFFEKKKNNFLKRSRVANKSLLETVSNCQKTMKSLNLNINVQEMSEAMVNFEAVEKLNKTLPIANEVEFEAFDSTLQTDGQAKLAMVRIN